MTDRSAWLLGLVSWFMAFGGFPDYGGVAIAQSLFSYQSCFFPSLCSVLVNKQILLLRPCTAALPFSSLRDTTYREISYLGRNWPCPEVTWERVNRNPITLRYSYSILSATYDWRSFLSLLKDRRTVSLYTLVPTYRVLELIWER